MDKVALEIAQTPVDLGSRSWFLDRFVIDKSS
jgi:hypothetical protein